MATNPSRSPKRKRVLRRTDDPDHVRRQLYAAAKRYVDAGISVIPMRADGTKAPWWQLLPRRPNGKATWKPYQTRLPTLAELVEWFGSGEFPRGIAVVCGAVSGGWETIDFDDIELVLPWWKTVQHTDVKLLSRLVYVLSPRPGLHVHYRCQEIEGPRVLARGYRIDTHTQKNKLKALIETRGEGNYIVVPPSPGQCHETGEPYELIRDGGVRDLTEVQTITAEERELLIETAKQFNEHVPPARARRPAKPTTPTKYSASGLPGDDFNARGSWADILEPHGWCLTGVLDDGTEHWRRPHKGGGVSATVNYEGSDLLYVFSTNAEPFEEGRGYTKFTAYALLNHGGDFRAASRVLRGMGYGKPVARSLIDPLAPYRSLRLPSRRRG
jgi:Bifunctional DNA primase/polymerase, N-terminal